MTNPILHAVVIDDDPEMRGLHKRVLSQLGFEVVLTSNAGDGIEAVHQFDPVVTLLDVSMPGMDGFAAASRIREFSSTYVLMVSANSEEIDIVQGLGAGADDYIQKPFRTRELRARIEATLRRPRTFVAATAVEPTADRDADVWRPGVASDPVPPAPAPAPAPAATVPASLAQDREPTTRVVETPLVPAATPAVPERPAAQERPAATDRTSVAPTGGPAQGRLQSRPSGFSRVRPVDGVLARTEEPAVTVEGARLAAVAHAPVPQLVRVPDAQEGDVWVAYGSLALAPAHSLVRVDGEEIELPETEFALLAALVESGPRVRSTANLVLALRGESYVTTYYVNEADKSAVKNHMASLLRRLGDTGSAPRWIESVRGVGYRMTAV